MEIEIEDAANGKIEGLAGEGGIFVLVSGSAEVTVPEPDSGNDNGNGERDNPLKLDGSKKKKSGNASDDTGASGDAKGPDEVMVKLGEIIAPMKESFIVAYLIRKIPGVSRVL